jgi:hypothetical protein
MSVNIWLIEKSIGIYDSVEWTVAARYSEAEAQREADRLYQEQEAERALAEKLELTYAPLREAAYEQIEDLEDEDWYIAEIEILKKYPQHAYEEARYRVRGPIPLQ